MCSLSQFLWPTNYAWCWFTMRAPTHKVTRRFDHCCCCRWRNKLKPSPLLEWLWPPNLAGWELTLIDSHPQNHLTLWLCDLAKSLDKLKPLYIHYQCTYFHLTWQDGHLPKVKQRVAHVVLSLSSFLKIGF